MTGLTFLVVFLVLFSLLAIIPLILKRIHIPNVVAIMLVGIVIGPNGIDLIRYLNHILGRGYPTEQLYVVLDAMGLLGMVFLMALAGMEVNLKTFFHERRIVFPLSILTFAIPATTGFAVFSVFEPDNAIGAWVFASLFASHSVGIVFHVIREQKVIGTRIGLGLLGATVITDISSLILLATCIQYNRYSVVSVRGLSLFDHIDATTFGPWFPVVFIGSVCFFIAGTLWLAPRALNLIFSRLGIQGDGHLTYLLAGVLFIAFLGELLGISIIVSSFVAGMALVRSPAFQQDSRKLHREIEGIGFGFVIPILFLTIGMQTDLRVLFEARENLALVVTVVSGLVASKVFSGWLAMRISGFGHLKALCVGLMTTPQLDATLAAATVALHLKMIPSVFFNAVVILSVVTSIFGPIFTKLIILKGRITFDQLEDALSGASVDADIENAHL